MAVRPDFPRLLREFIREDSRSAVEIAHQAGISPQYLNDLARGRRDAVSFEVAERLAQTLGCDPNWLNAPVRVIVPYQVAREWREE